MICIWSILGKAIGVYILAKFTYFVWTFLRSAVFPLLGLGIIDLKSYGHWAVVTGATDGIGKSYAKELARKGLNIVLISRSQQKLDTVAKEITEAYNVNTKTIAFDYGTPDGYEKIEKVLKDMNIGVLVNNVGMTHGTFIPEYFGSMQIDIVQKMLNVNMLSAVKMTHIVLQEMLARKKGVLIHISSGAGTYPMPLGSIYSGTKVFLDFFARALQIEYRDQGIISQSVLPLFVATKMTEMKPSLAVPDPDTYASRTLQTVGIVERTNGYWTHILQNAIANLIPAFLTDKLVWWVAKLVRADALKRMEKGK